MLQFQNLEGAPFEKDDATSGIDWMLFAKHRVSQNISGFPLYGKSSKHSSPAHLYGSKESKAKTEIHMKNNNEL